MLERCPSGSPPQVRGKLAFARAQASQDGITPAGAGKTSVSVNGFNLDGDHPRRCGENPCRRGGEGVCGGSPPQVRGKHNIYSLDFVLWGITPAGAGKT